MSRLRYNFIYLLNFLMVDVEAARLDYSDCIIYK